MIQPATIAVITCTSSPTFDGYDCLNVLNGNSKGHSDGVAFWCHVWCRFLAFVRSRDVHEACILHGAMLDGLRGTLLAFEAKVGGVLRIDNIKDGIHS